MEKVITYLEEAEKINRAIGHIMSVTFPLLKDKQVLIRSLTELKKSAAYAINAILQYEYLYRRIQLYKDPKMNLKAFINKCSKKYNLSQEEAERIKELFSIIEQHKESAMEFTRNEKLVIITDSQTKTVGIPEIRQFLEINKKMVRNAKEHILRKI
tara:strand:- start:46236 stop:46703 length:468 start_codon:yes stop_codon:yes gene_type:complete